MTTPPAQLTYGLIRWNAIGLTSDTPADLNDLPDVVPINGTATLHANVDGAFIPAPGLATPRTVLLRDIPLLIVNGQLQDADGHTDVKALANDAPPLAVKGWSYTLSFQLDDGFTFGTIIFELKTDELVDLTTEVPLLSPSPGVVVTSGPPGPPGEAYGGGVVVGPADPAQPLVLEITSRFGIRDDGTVYYNSNGVAPSEAGLLVPDPATGQFTVFRPGGPFSTPFDVQFSDLINDPTSESYGALEGRFLASPNVLGIDGQYLRLVDGQPTWVNLDDLTPRVAALESDVSRIDDTLLTLATPEQVQDAVAGQSERLDTEVQNRVAGDEVLQTQITDNLSRADGTKATVDAATEAATANTLAKRDAAGRMQVATPTLDGEAAPKSYIDSLVGYNLKQAALYAAFWKRLKSGTATTLACQGDSLTYGHDVVSPDKVAADPNPAGDGTAHTFTRSPWPFPATLQSRLRDVYGAQITVVNRGYSGDTVSSSFTRWPASSGAHLTMFCLGVNDARNIGDTTAYANGMDALIRRELDRGAAVVLLTPPKQLSAGESAIESYRLALDAVAARYGIPVIDAEEFVAGYSGTIYSDTTHYNTQGYLLFGTRLAACFIGPGPAQPYRVHSGSRLGIRPTIDPVQYDRSGGTLTTGSFGTPDDEAVLGSAGISPGIKLGSSGTYGTAYFSVYVEDADTIVLPQFYIEAGTAAGSDVDLLCDLDWGMEQADSVYDFIAAETPWATEPVATTGTANRPVSSFGMTLPVNGGGKHVRFTPSAVRAGVWSGQYLRIPARGWHTVRVRARGSLVAVHAMEFLGQRVYTQLREAWGTGWQTAAPLLNGWAAVGGFYPPQYRKLGNGDVELRGVASGGANGAEIFTLPEGYRPGGAPEVFSVAADAITGRLDINTSGLVSRASGSGYLTLSSLKFSTLAG